MKRLTITLNIIILLLLSCPVYAGPPLDMVRTNVNKVLDVLRNPALKSPSAKETKKKKLESIYVNMFDEVELSRRTLARNWNRLDAAQRRDFVHLFRQVLENAYIDKKFSYTNEKIFFDRETMLSENQAEVQTMIITSSKEIPISYRIILGGGVWKVYDVVVENVSLVQNYRTQFNEILAKNTFEELMKILQKKLTSQRS